MGIEEQREENKRLALMNTIHVVFKTPLETEVFATIRTTKRRPFYKVKQLIIEKNLNRHSIEHNIHKTQWNPKLSTGSP